ncbi:SMR domain-containing protein [Schizosaccharomyces pombe]
MQDWRAALEEYYSRYLDSALVLAIVNDSDDSNTAREILEALSIESQCDSHEEHWDNLRRDEQELLNLKTLDEEINKIDEEDFTWELKDSSLELDPDVYNFLRSMFSDLSAARVQLVQAKCQNDLVRSSDELLNHRAIQESEQIETAADALIASNIGHRSRQRKKKTKKATNSRKPLSKLQSNTEEVNEDPILKPSLSVWENNRLLIEKLTSILNIPSSQISHEFYKNSSAWPITIRNLIHRHQSLSNITNNELMKYQEEATQLAKDTGLSLRICTDVLICSNDYKNALWILCLIKETQHNEMGNIKLSSQTAKSNSSTQTKTCLNDQSSKLVEDDEALSAEDCNRLAEEYLELRNMQYSNSAKEYRRSKSNHLFGGSAMYHAQLGREYHEKALKYRSLAMRSLAHSGTSHSLDLHGATVREAKTIVRERVAAWWAKEADTSPNSIRPFVIVTGRGNHSIGLEARLLPAIVRLLQQDHWRFDAEHGQITVYGINRHSKLNSNA